MKYYLGVSQVILNVSATIRRQGIGVPWHKAPYKNAVHQEQLLLRGAIRPRSVRIL